MSLLHLAVLCDYPEEGWPSMDLCAEMLLRRLRAEHAARVRAARVCPPFRRRLGRVPLLGRRWGANADRLLNRFWGYPRHLRRRVQEFDLFHLCDHSYSQLIHELPAGRAGVLCHDLDTFRCVLEPQAEPRPRWFRRMARRVLDGFRKAAVVFHVSGATRRQIEKHGLADPARLVHAPNGIAPEFTAEETEDGSEESVLPGLGGRPFLLNVGSCIPRKRIDVLLDVFAGVRARHPGLALVQVGGSWTAPQREQIGRLGIAAALLQVRGLTRAALARLYRRAALVLQPSEAEGFGLPLVETLACGSPVLASDIPVLREVGGAAAVYCPVADRAAWIDAACKLVEDPAAAPARPARLAHARRYSWSAQAQTIVTAYEHLLQPA
jgi:glycosyltransferase involved in cell wall biosynthesis